MIKPIIFFSHSSRDRDRILPIKEHILSGTGNTIKIFMSSDGASIPFGKNWQKEIEEALTNCKLMFSWITKNSIESSWIFFETGYAYSRAIKVVPIGFDGINLEGLPGPLGMLQGFNINSSASLNNIIAIINHEFDLKFNDIFNDDFFSSYVIQAAARKNIELLEYIREINCIFYPMKDNSTTEPCALREDWLDIFINVIKDKGQIYTQSNDGVIFGVGYKIYLNKILTPNAPTISIDPLALDDIWETLADLNRGFYSGKSEKLFIDISLKQPFELPDDHYLISARLRDTEVNFDTIAPSILYNYRNISFRLIVDTFFQIRGKVITEKKLRIMIDQGNNEDIPLLPLMKLLEKQKVISANYV